MSDRMDELIEVMREILKWTKFAGAREVRNILTATLDTEQKRLIYNSSDGNKGSVEIAKTAGVGDSTIRRYWESWARRGAQPASPGNGRALGVDPGGGKTAPPPWCSRR